MPLKPSESKKPLIVAVSAHMSQDGLAAATYVLLPFLADAFGLSYAQVGAIKGLKSLAQGLLEVASGFLSERYSEIQVLVVGLLLAGIGFMTMANTSSVAVIILCLMVTGIGGGLQHAPASALVSKSYEIPGRRSALGLYNSSGDVGKLLFSGIFSVAIGAGIAWQQLVFSFGALVLFAAFAVAFLVAVHRPHHENSTDNVDLSRTSQKIKGWGVFNASHFSFLLFVVFFDNAVQAGVLVFVAFLMIAKELPLYLATLATVVVLIGGVFGKAGCGYLAEKIGVRRAFVLMQLLTAIGLVAIIFAPKLFAFVLLLPLGIVSQGSTSITYGLLPDYIHPTRMARGYAILYSITSFAAALGPLGIGITADHYGMPVAFGVMALLSLFALFPLLLSSEFADTSNQREPHSF